MRKKYTLVNKIYYEIKPALPRSLQIAMRRVLVNLIARKYRDIWPINPEAGNKPLGWQGWPHNKKFALVLTHDVDTVKGEERCLELMKLDMKAGFKSAFYFVPGRMEKSAILIPELKKNGFEVGVHGLFHDGKLFKSERQFQAGAILINHYLSKWQAKGFRAECMHHNLEWIGSLNIQYDASTFDVDPFEPQPDGMSTIFPFMVESRLSGKSYVELPYTLAQDFMLFIIMQKTNADIWEKKLEWIATKEGMALLIAHPDYMNFGNNRLAREEYRADIYAKFLAHIKHKYEGLFWNALPSELALHFVSTHSVSRA